MDEMQMIDHAILTIKDDPVEHPHHYTAGTIE